MIVGIGIDILEVSRLSQDLQEKSGLREEIFTPAEIAYCESKRYPAPHYTARFCAKEALFKALGTGYRSGMSWREIEVSPDELGQPTITVFGKVKENLNHHNVKQVHLSLSHTKTVATALIVLETDR